MFEYHRKNIIVFLGGLVLVIGFLNIYGPMLYGVHITLLQRFLSSTILFIALYPTYFFLRGEYDGVPFLTLWGWVFSVIYGVRVFIFGTRLGKLGYFQDSLIETALLLVLIGLASCYLGYFLINSIYQTPTYIGILQRLKLAHLFLELSG